MQNILVQLIKYGMILLIILYTYHAYAALRGKEGRMQKKRFSQMTAFLFLQHLLGSLAIFIQVENTNLIALYVAQLALIFAVLILYPKLYPNLSKLMLLNMLQLIQIGFVIMARLSFDKAIRQTLLVFVGFLLASIIPKLMRKIEWLKNFGWLLGCVGIVILVIVLIAGISRFGATNWFQLGNVIFQPSEFVKIIFIFSIAASYHKNWSFTQICAVSVMAAATVLILVFGKDLGGALIYFVTYLMLLYLASEKIVYLISGVLAGSIASYFAYHFFQHVKVRVIAWSNPFKYIDKEGFQISQSLFAIGTGGWFGMGLNRGLPTSIPIVESDFVFSAITEELGGIYAISLIFIYINIFMEFMRYGIRLRDKYNRLIVMGIAVMFSFQVFLSIGGVIKLIPSTGVTLPFISYGGSSLLTSIFMIMIYQGIFIKRSNQE